MGTADQYRSFLANVIYCYFSAGTTKSYGVVMEKTIKEFSTHYFLVGWAFSLQYGTCHFVAPLVCLLRRNFNDRLLAFCGGVLACLGYIIRGLTPLKSVWQLFALTGVVGAGFGLVKIATFTSMKSAFQESFPLANIMTTPSLTVGAATMPLLLDQLMKILGSDYGMLAVGLFTMTLVSTSIIIPGDNKSDISDPTKDRTHDETSQLMRSGGIDNLPNGGQPRNQRNSPKCRTVLKLLTSCFHVFYNHPQFAFLLMTDVIVTVEYTSWSIFLVPYGEYLGLDSERAVLLSTIGGSSGFIGRIISIIFIHRNISYKVTCFLLPSLLMVIGYLLSLFFDSFAYIAVTACLSGLSVGMQVGLPSSAIPLCVCDNCFESGVIWMFAVTGVVNQLGAIMTGGIVDITGSYRAAFACLAGLSFLQTIVTSIWTVRTFSKDETCLTSD